MYGQASSVWFHRLFHCFTNSLNPTIENLQNKIKRWINTKVTSSLGPAGRSCSCTRPAGVRVCKLPSPPARPAAVRMCVRPPGGRTCAQAPARCPQGPLTPATSGRRAARGGTGAREGLLAGLAEGCRARAGTAGPSVHPPTAGPAVGRSHALGRRSGARASASASEAGGDGPRMAGGDEPRLAAACGGPARVRHRRLAHQADHTGGSSGGVGGPASHGERADRIG
jgi:hypothetical protein